MAEETKKYYLTEEGYKECETRLNYLINVERPAIVERIKIAKEQGDLSENAEYSAAREEQGKIEGEILELQERIKYAEIIEKGSSNVVSMGVTVRIKDLKFNEECEYTLVGTTEVNLLEGKISNESALGSALLGAKKGQTVSVDAPNGSYSVKILEIKA